MSTDQPPSQPRQQPIREGLLPAPADVSAAKAACFRERSEYIRRFATLGGLTGLQAIVDVYGDEALAVLIEYDRMCDTDGPATMSRLLRVFSFQRVSR